MSLHPVARGVQACAAAGIRIVPDHEWRAQVDYDRMARRPIDVEGGQGFTHWFGTPVSRAAAAGMRDAEAAALRSGEKYHLSLGWAGLAYDVTFGNSGSLYLVRTDARSAATSGDVDMDGIPNNVEGDAGCFIIGRGQEPSSLALRTADVFWNGHGISRLIPHSDGRGSRTECPGPILTPWARRWRRTTKGPVVPTAKNYAQAVVFDAEASDWDKACAAVVAEAYVAALVEWRDGTLLSVTHPGTVANVGFAWLVGLANSTVSRSLFPDGTNRIGSIEGEDDTRWTTARDVVRTLVDHPPGSIERRGKPW